MKQILVYQAENGEGLQNIYLKKSAALASDAITAAMQASKKLIDPTCKHTQQQEILAKAFQLLSEQAISPRRLLRVYSKIWQIRKEVQAAITAETLKEGEAKTAEAEDCPF